MHLGDVIRHRQREGADRVIAVLSLVSRLWKLGPKRHSFGYLLDFGLQHPRWDIGFILRWWALAGGTALTASAVQEDLLDGRKDTFGRYGKKGGRRICIGVSTGIDKAVTKALNCCSCTSETRGPQRASVAKAGILRWKRAAAHWKHRWKFGFC